MISNLTPTLIAVIIIGAPSLILIMFLPALLELKKPKDSGPRRIMDDFSEMQGQMGKIIPIVNIEEEQKFDVALVKKIATIIAALPSLET